MTQTMTILVVVISVVAGPATIGKSPNS